MKKILLTVMMAAAVSFCVNAQEAKKKDRFANLNLTEQQKASVDSVRKLYDGQRTAIKNDATASEEAKKEKLNEIRKEQAKAINGILTDEQRKQLKAGAKKNEK